MAARSEDHHHREGSGERPARALAQGPAFYCQGWLRQLLSPTPLVWHNGGTIGSKAVVAFTPDGDLGLVVLSNLDGTDLPEALMYYLYDLYHARPAKDYAAEFLADAKARAEAGKFPPRRRRQLRDGTRWPTPEPTAARTTGRLAADVRDGTLLLTVGPRKTPVRLKHWDGDTFAISPARLWRAQVHGWLRDLRVRRGGPGAGAALHPRIRRCRRRAIYPRGGPVAISAMLGRIRRCSTP